MQMLSRAAVCRTNKPLYQHNRANKPWHRTETSFPDRKVWESSMQAAPAVGLTSSTLTRNCLWGCAPKLIQYSPLGKFSLPTATPKRAAKSRFRLLLKLRIHFHFHITKDTNMPDVNVTPHHVWALSAGTSNMDRVLPNKQSSEARKAAQKRTQKEHLPEIKE